MNLNSMHLFCRSRNGVIRKLIVACLCCVPMFAAAHGLHLDASSDGHTITGVVYYSNGKVADQVAVKLHNLSTEGAKPALTLTDATGRFRFQVESSQRYRIVVHENESHSVAAEIRAEANAVNNAHHHHAAGHHHGATAQHGQRIPWAWAIFAGLLLTSCACVAALRLSARQTART